MKHQRILLLFVLVTVLAAGIAVSQTSTRVAQSKVPNLVELNSPEDAISDKELLLDAGTTDLLGGSLDNGDFQDEFGLPNWDGWTPVDLTTAGIPNWHIDNYNSANLDPGQPGNNAWWCGQFFADDCMTGDFGGYGNNWDDRLDWEGVVGNSAVPTTITVTGVLNFETEPGYDFLTLEFETSGSGYQVAASFDGYQSQFMLSETFTMLPGEYTGPGNDEVHLRWRFLSDGAWSDEDCTHMTMGAAQIDLLTVSFNGVQQGQVEDCDSNSPQWTPSSPSPVGNFGKVWPLLMDVDLMQDNVTPQVAFIDDGIVEPGTGGSTCVTWCYGPSGYVVNSQGGLAGPDNHLWNEVWSPLIEWTVPSSTRAFLECDLYIHDLMIPGVSAGILAEWRVRSTDNPDPGVSEDWSPWQSDNTVYWGGPFYQRLKSEVTEYLVPNPTWVQVALGAQDIGWIWSADGNDASPSPYFDNVNLRALTEPVQFSQVAYNMDGNFTDNTDWGFAELTFAGDDSLLYFNLTVDGSWQVQNMPLVTLHEVGAVQSQRFYFDLGNTVGDDVTSLTYGYSITPAIIGSQPTGSNFADVANDTIVVVYGSIYSDFLTTPLSSAPGVGGAAASGNRVQHRHKDFPNQLAGNGECAPVAVSNSLQFLNRVHKLGLAAEDISIDKIKTATNWGLKRVASVAGPGVDHVISPYPSGWTDPRDIPGCWIDADATRPAGEKKAWWESKRDYMLKNRLPITTRHFPVTDIGKMVAEIDRGQDIEAEIGGHTVAIVGITPLGNGRYSVNIAHDKGQKGDKSDLVEETDVWNSNTGQWEGVLKGRGRSLAYFVVECPRNTDGNDTHTTTTDPGSEPMTEAPWAPVNDNPVTFPGTVGESIWIGKNNVFVLSNEKTWTIVLTGPDAQKYGIQEVHGYINTIPVSEVAEATVTGVKDVAGPPVQRIFTLKLNPQPDWEVVKIVRTEAKDAQVDAILNVRSYSHCHYIVNVDQRTRFTGWAGVLGEDMHITEVIAFPLGVPIEPTGNHEFSAPATSGNWNSEVVWVDPDGLSRPLGGVRWTSSGTGLLAEEQYSHVFEMAGTADESFDYYLYDATIGEYMYYRMTTATVTAVPETAPILALQVKAHPNPFNLATVLSYSMPSRERLSLKIFNLRGELVRTLINRVVEEGHGQVTWDGQDSEGRVVASGVYFYEARSEAESARGKVLLIK